MWIDGFYASSSSGVVWAPGILNSLVQRYKGVCDCIHEALNE